MVKLNKDSIEYLGQWAMDSEQWDDYRLFYERGFFELCAARIVSAGAVNSRTDSKEAANIIDVAKAITWDEERALIDDALDGVSVFICSTCNAHSFVDLENECIDREEFESWGCYACLKNTVKYDSTWGKK